MSKKAWIWTAIVFVAITAAIIAFVLWDESRTSQRLSAETEAVGIESVAMQWYDNSKERNVSGHTVTFAYAVGQTGYPRTLEQVTWFDPAVQYKVCYNRADPEHSKLYPASHTCGG
ncbi:MAG TPA: hypothetical protein VK993_07525 [Chthoniobacterales bacterium]|nr:hypothetical protein [Chthoniobacterales bacterium]